MDGRRFDDLTRALGAPGSRRGFLKGLLGAGLAAAGFGRLAGPEVGAQVSQAQCGNVTCKNNPEKCAAGCICCVYGNGNTRCTPPGSCSGTPTCPPGKFVAPVLGCVDCLSSAHCPGPTDGNPCQTAACIAGKCGIQSGNLGATCAQTTCAGGTLTSYACDAAGACSASSTTQCLPYVCASDGINCRTSCTGDGDCAGSAFCRDGACVGDLPQGAACTRNEQCATGYCTNGVCCVQAACSTCQACNSLGNCAVVAGGPCTPADTCFAGVCTDSGTCVQTGPPRDCEPRECEYGVCQNGDCQYFAVEGEPSCGESGECFARVCRSGLCQEVPRNENQSCSGGTTCNPKVCLDRICESVPERANGASCPGGICFGGTCCQGATDEGICHPEFNCCADAQCCGSGCCDDCFTSRGDTGDTEYTCCPPTSLCPPNTPNAPGCCYSDETCHQASNGGHSCIRSALICGGTTVCGDECCGSSCCADGQYCNGTACVSVPTATCTSDSDCRNVNLTCTGVVEEIDFETGELVVVTPGSCCPANRACPDPDYQGPGSGPANYCLPYGRRCDFEGRTCDYAYYLSCGGTTCECSPRGGRTRL